MVGSDDMMSGGNVQSEDGGGGGADGTTTMAGDEGGAEGDDVVVGNDDMMSDGDVQSESGDDGNAEGAAAMGVIHDNEMVNHDTVTSATDVDGGGGRGGAKRSRDTDDEGWDAEEDCHGPQEGVRNIARSKSAQQRGEAVKKRSGRKQRPSAKVNRFGGTGT